LALGFARLAAFRLIFEVLIVKEVLLTRGKYKLRTAIRTLDDSILKFCHHHRSRGPTQATLTRPLEHMSEGEDYSTSRRLFFLFRFRANACLARFFSPGFK
jgi:hypothetical protein